MNFHGSFRAGNLPINKILIKVITAGLFSYIPLNLLDDKTIENFTLHSNVQEVIPKFNRIVKNSMNTSKWCKTSYDSFFIKQNKNTNLNIIA